MDTRFAAGSAPAVRSTTPSPSIARERRYAARNYDTLPCRAERTIGDSLVGALRGAGSPAGRERVGGRNWAS